MTTRSVRHLGLGAACLVLAVTGHYTHEVLQARAETPELIRRDLAEATLEPEALSPEQLHALLLFQDPRFFEHHGWDFAHGRITTITQALAKRYYFAEFHRGVLPKIRQSLIARFALDPLTSKRDQLKLFINVVYLGTAEGRPVNGLAAGAQAFYGKRFGDLTRDEFLSLLVFDKPSILNPRADPAGNARRVAQMKARLAREAGAR